MSANPLSLRDAARELGMLAFVEQDLERQHQAGQITGALLATLRERLDQRQRQIYNRMIERVEGARQWRTLLGLIRAAARRAPGSANLYEQAGMVAVRLGQEREALAELEHAVLLGSRDFSVLCELGRLYAASDRPTEAALALETAAAWSPEEARHAKIPAQLAQRAAAEREAAQASPRRARPQLAETPARMAYLQGFLAEVALAVGRPDWLPQPPAPAAPAAPTAPQPPHPSPTSAAPARPAVARAPQRTFDWAEFWSALFSERMLHALLYLGATLLVISAFIWMAFNWNRFAAPVQLASLGAITTVFYGCGWAVRSKLGLLRSGSTLIAIGAGWVAVIGWALANLVGLSPPQTWLLVSALCLPAYLVTTLWLREEIFSALSAVACVNLLLAGLHLAGVGRAGQGCALVVLSISFVALSPTLGRLRGGQRLAGPPVWVAQTLVPLTLIGAALALKGGWLSGPLDRALLATIWWLGAAHYLLSLRRMGGLAYEQALAWVAPAALALSAEVAGLTHAWHGVLLLAATPLYLLVAPACARTYAGSRRPWLRYRLAWPAYSTPYLLALLALVWPGANTVALLVASLGVAALCGMSAQIFRHPAWVWLACASGLLAGWHLATLLTLLTLPAWIIGLALAGAAYWLVGVALERAPRYALAPLVVGYGLLGLALALALGLAPNPPSSSVAFLLVIAVSVASAALLQGGRLSAIRSARASSTAPETLFAAVAAALLPGWLATTAPQLPAHTLDLALLVIGAAYLAGAQALRPRDGAPGPAAPGFDGLLTAMAVALSGLALAGLGRAQPFLSFSLLLVAWAVGRVLAGQLARNRLDTLALAGGLLGLGLALMPTHETEAQALLVIVGAAGLYLLGAGLQRRAAWLYLLGGPLCGGWLLGLRLLSVPLVQQPAWLAPAALLAVAGGLLAEWRGWPRAATPGYIYGYGLGAISMLVCLVLFGRGQLVGGQPHAVLALAALAALAVVSMLRFRADPFAALAGLLPALAYLLTLSAAQVPLGRYGLAFAGLALIYLSLAALRAQRGPAAEGRGLASRLIGGLALFEPTLQRGFHLLALVALAGGGVALVSGGPRGLAPICLLLAAAYGLGAYWLRRPGMVAAAAPLAAAGATAIFAGYLEPLAPASARGALWVLLAWTFVGVARRLNTTPAPYRRPIFATGFTLAALACGWAIFDRPLLLVTLGGLLLVCLRWDRTLGELRLNPRWRGWSLPVVPDLPPFLSLVAVLTPLWVWLLLDEIGLSRPQIGLSLTLLAAVWLAVAQLVRRRPNAATPFLATCYALVALAPALAGIWPGLILAALVGLYVSLYSFVSRYVSTPARRFLALIGLSPLIALLAGSTVICTGYAGPRADLAGMFGLASVIFAASARLQRRPLWALTAAATAPVAALLGATTFLPGETPYITTLLALGIVNLGSSWLLERRGAARSYGQPLDAAGALCGLLALTLTVVLPPGFTYLPLFDLILVPGVSHLALRGAALALFALGAARHRDPLWLYGSTAAALLAYPLLTEILGLTSTWMGVALLPGAFAAFGLGQLLERRVWPDTPTWRPRLISPAYGFAWGLPAYLLALAGALAAIPISLGGAWPLAISLGGAAALSAWAAHAWGRQRWQWLALGLAHLAYLADVWAAMPDLMFSSLPLILLPALLVCLGAGLQAEGRNALAAVPARQRLTTRSWAQSYYAFVAFDTGLAVIGSLPLGSIPTTSLVVSGVLAVVAGVLATLWRDGQLATAALPLLALALDGLMRHVGLDSTVRLMLLAAQGIGAWWLAQGLERRARASDTAAPAVWPAPLRRWGHLANLGALLWALNLTTYGVGVVPLSRGLALAGLFYAGVALRERQLRLSYLASGMLVAAWMLTALTAMPDQLQAYAIPAGLYLLGVGAAERWRGSPRRLCQLIELLGMTLLLGVSLWQSLPASFGYGALLGAEALLVIVWGALQRVRLLFFGGIVAFLTNLAVQSLGPIQAADKALLAFAVGLLLVGAAVFIERRRDQLREQARRIWAQLETWS